MPLIQVQKSTGNSTWSQSSASKSGKRKLLKAHNYVPKEHNKKDSGMNTLKSSSSERSSSKRSTSSSRRSRNNDSQFQKQHDNMMSRQQFRTNTSRSVSRNRGSKIPREVNGPPLSVYGTQSYDSGYSHISRKSEAIPQTIQRPESDRSGISRDENIHKVKIIVAGKTFIVFKRNLCSSFLIFLTFESN